MPSYQAISRESFWTPGKEEALHIADETNCVRWIVITDEPREEPFAWPCSDHHHGQEHLWRTAWTLA